MIIKFKACKHLDFETNYANCNRQLIGSFTGDKMCWSRKIEQDLVQFCKKGPRLNCPNACLSSGTSKCSNFELSIHKINVNREELER